MEVSNVDVVTGAYSYTGRFIAARLLEHGRAIRTLTNHPRPDDPSSGRIRAFPLDFGDAAQLVEAMNGTDTLYNTYWVRAPHGSLTHTVAVENIGRLVEAAHRAGVRRIVHTSIANPTASTRGYYRGKAAAEEVIRSSGLSYAIVRPTLLFGEGDVLINNIGWLLRRLPIFGIPGNGRYRLQPIHVRDHANLLVAAGSDSANLVLDSAGLETFTFEDLVRLIGSAVGARSLIVRMPAALAMLGATVAGRLSRDMVLTRDELDDLMDDILVSHEPPRGTTRLSEWLAVNRDTVGRRYASEMDRHYRRPLASG
jgi:nucleoside-diphosphate-sugar epimerase